MGAFALSGEVIDNMKTGFRPLTWTHNGLRKPESEYSFFERNFRWLRHLATGWVDDTRFEHFMGLDAVQSSKAATQHGFEYVGDGYFYSKYEMSNTAQAFKWVGELAEGSLFDWQIGDLLDKAFDRCQTGDIRGWFYVADPAEVTVLASVKDANGTLGVYRTKKFDHRRRYAFARLFPGEVSFEFMKATNKWEFVKVLTLQRVLAVLWATLVLRVLTKPELVGYCHTVLPPSLFNPFSVFGLAGLLVTAKWTLVYGISDFTGHETSVITFVALCGSLVLLFYGSPMCRTSTVKQRIP